MTVTGHPNYDRLRAALRLASGHFHPWTGTIYRSAPPKWAAGRDMLTGAGSMRAGGRYNAAGSFPAVYGSTTPELAMIESLAYQRRAGLPVDRALPLVFKAISVDVERLLDLSDAFLLTELGITLDEIRTETWWLARARGEESLGQALGRATFGCGVQAISVISAHTLDHGQNIIAFPTAIIPPSRLKVLRRSPKR